MSDLSLDLATELRTTFLFESVTEEELAFVAGAGDVVTFDSGVRIFAEGEPAEYFYVLLEGGVRLLRQVGREEIVLSETAQRGVYAGATRAFVPRTAREGYASSLETTAPSRLFRLPAKAFADFMQRWYPLAVHLLEGLFLGMRSSEGTVRQREKLASLGALSAGLAHELNNPAAAGTRAAEQLRDRVAAMRHKLAMLAGGKLDPGTLAQLVDLQEEAVARAAKAPRLSAVEESDLEDALTDWLDNRDVSRSWELAPIFVAAGLDVDWAEHVAAAVAEGVLEGALRWLAYTVETEALMSEITDATTRISSLVAAAKQYSRMDQASHAEIDLHLGLDSTVAMLGHKLGGISVVTDYDGSLPHVPANGGELNQVWTNLIVNAVEAMAGSGTLTLRTSREGSEAVVDVIDDGPGVPPEIVHRIFDAFFTTKPVGEGTGLGLEISRRIVETTHHGRMEVDSRPGATRFRVRLPLTATPGSRPVDGAAR